MIHTRSTYTLTGWRLVNPNFPKIFAKRQREFLPAFFLLVVVLQNNYLKITLKFLKSIDFLFFRLYYLCLYR
jgi:hypothetical protein